MIRIQKRARKHRQNLPVVEVAPFVIPHVALGAETLATALWTRIGPLIRVNSVVDSQILLLAEGFRAGRALVRLSPVVHVHMDGEADLAVEDFSAVRYRANEDDLLLAAPGGRSHALPVKSFLVFVCGVFCGEASLLSCSLL